MMRRFLIFGAVLLTLLVIYSLLMRFGIHYVDRYRETVARMLSEAIEMPVHVGSLQGDGLRIRPRLRITALQIGTPGQEVFGARRLELELRPVQSLFYLAPRLHRVRAEGCIIRMASPSLDSGRAGRMVWTSHLFSLVDVKVQNCRAELRLADGEQHELTMRDMRMQRAGFGHLRLSAKGAHANDDMHLLGEIRRDWRGLHTMNVYAKAGLNAMPWWRLPFGAGLQTQGAETETWLSWRRGQGLDGTVRLQADSIRRYAQSREIHIADVSGLFTFRVRNQQHWYMEGRHIHFSLEDTPAQINAIAAAKAGMGQLFYADSIDIEKLSILALQTLPLERRLRESLQTMQPRGDLRQILLRVPADNPKAGWNLQASVVALEIKPWKGVPGIKKMQGPLKINPSEGSFDAVSKDMEFYLAPLYQKPQRYQDVKLSLYWRMEGEQILLQGRNLRANLDKQGRVRGYFNLRMAKRPESFAPRLGLHIDGMNISLNQSIEHIPKKAHKQIPPWAVDAGGQGILRQVSVDIRGPVRKSLLNQVEVKVHGEFEGAELVPMTDLHLKGLKGNLDYVRPELKLALRITEGEAFGHAWSGGNANFQNIPGSWQLSLDTPLAGGKLAGTRYGEPLRADLQYLYLPALPEGKGLSSSSVAFQARIADLRYDGEERGSWQFAAELEPGRVVLSKLQGNIGAIHINSRKGDGANLVWDTGSEDSRSYFNGEVRFCDWPKILVAHGCDINATKPNGRIQASLEWPGNPQDFLVEKSSGSARLRLQDGEFLQVESPGPLRLLELFNIESLLVRLQQNPVKALTGSGGLDYEDVTAVGLLQDGLLLLREPDGIEVESSSGSEFMLTGTINLRERTFEGELATSFSMSGNLPLFTLLLQGTPALAAGTWVVGKVLQRSIYAGPSAKYKVSGPWDNLTLEPVDAPKDDAPSEAAQP